MKKRWVFAPKWLFSKLIELLRLSGFYLFLNCDPIPFSFNKLLKPMNQFGSFNFMIFMCTLFSNQPLKITTFANNYFFLFFYLTHLSWIMSLLILCALLNGLIYCSHLWELHRLPFSFHLTLIFSERKS